MPHSSPIFKKETVDFITNKFGASNSVLDIGAGAGSYSDHLRSFLGRFDGVEIFEPYIDLFGLQDKYDQIVVKDALSFDFNYYDLILVGDVLEHMSESDGISFIQKIYNKCEELIITIPFNSDQGVHYDNEYEIHLQNELTNESFLQKYSGFRPLALRYDYGVYIKDTVSNQGVDLILEEDSLPPAFSKDELFKTYPSINILRYEDGEKVAPPLAPPVIEQSNLTIVSGLWDIGREGRSFDQYKDAFNDFLKIPQKMVLFIPKELEDFVWERRETNNTRVVIFELEDIRVLFDSFWDDVQSIRQDPKWYNATGENGWLSSSPQAVNEWYNPLVMSKYSLLHTACCYNDFNTDYFLWVDAGLSSTVDHVFMDEKNVFSKIEKYLNPFLFLSYPYEANTEIHGFEIEAMNDIARDKVSYVCRGGLFGGHKDFIHQGNEVYWHLLKNTLSSGYMGTEEPIFTLMSYIEPHIYRRYSLDSNGLVTKFIQELDSTGEVSLEKAPNNRKVPKPVLHDISHVKTNLYFLTFNYPDQLEYTIAALAEHNGFTDGPHQKVVIDNSTNNQARIDNKKVCDKHGFEHIIQEKNTGICGGRQCAAEHFHDSAADFYLFFEDDMTLSAPEEQGCCRNGFKKYIPDLYLKLHQIMIKEDFDFLKLNFTEVYMDNNIQTSWYNVPQDIRDTQWPEYKDLPTHGIDPHSPRTKFKNIERIADGLCYISGEIYYCNWPIIVSRKGNQKMFIDTKWAHYFEGTWMSYIFQETKKGNINPAVLLASPVTHERFKHYKPEERIEGSIMNPDLQKIKNL